MLYTFLSLVPVLNWIALGYAVQIIQNVAARNKRPLPEWDEWERYFENGARVAAAMIAYMSPVIVAWLLTGLALKPDSKLGGLAFVGVLVSFALTFYAMWLPALIPMLFIQVARYETVSACWQWGEMWYILRKQATAYILLVAACYVLGGGALYLAGLTFLGTMFYVPDFVPILNLLLFVWYVVLSVVWFLSLLVIGHLAGQFVVQAEKKLKRWRKRKGV